MMTCVPIMQCWCILSALSLCFAVAAGNSSNTSAAVNTEQIPRSLSPTQSYSHVESKTTLQFFPTPTFGYNSLIGKQTTIRPTPANSTTAMPTSTTITVEPTTVSNLVLASTSVHHIPTSTIVSGSPLPTTVKPTVTVNTTVVPTVVPTPGKGPRQPFILFANRQLIQWSDLNGGGEQVLVNNSGSDRTAVGIDFDARNSYMFWSDISRRTVMRARLDGSEITTLIDSGLEIPDDIAYDWISEKIYWTDAVHQEIEVVDLGGSGDRRILLKTGASSTPRAIVLDPTTRWMYWTDWGTPAKIEKASMDGLSRTIIHSINLTWPNALTIDYENQDLYWGDANLDRLETSKVDGSNRRVITTRFILHPFSITFFEGFLYWTDWQFNAIVALPVNSPNLIRGILVGLQLDPMGITIVSRDRQPEAPNPCAVDNGNCSSLCLLSAVAEEGYTCACSGLAPNQRDCLSRPYSTSAVLPSPTPLQTGSCMAAGYRECCTEGDCLGEPPICFCDAFCFDLDECCSDISLTCRQANTSIPLPSLPALASTPISTLQSIALQPSSTTVTPAATPTSVALQPSSTTLTPTVTPNSIALQPSPTTVIPAATPTSIALQPSSTTLTPTAIPTSIALESSSPMTPTVTPTPVGPSSEPYLLFANREFIRRSSLMALSTSEVIVNTSGSNTNHVIVGIDFDIRNNYMFWSDLRLKTIMRAQLDGSEMTTLVNTGLALPDIVAFDWVNGKLYWTDGTHREIEVMDVNTRDRRILLKTGNESTPRAIVLDPTTRWMYWTDWGTPAKIEKASMDGFNRSVIHNTDLIWPNGLTLDYETQILYWADASLDRIESSNIDGSNRILLTTLSTNLHPFSITFFRGVLYLSDWFLQSIISVPLNASNRSTTIVLPLDLAPMAVHVVARERQPEAPNPCANDNGNCSSLCLLSSVAEEGYTCACSEGTELEPNQRDCQGPTTVVFATPSPTPMPGSCVAAGYSGCCTRGDCLGQPPVCSCDLFCYDFDECCPDIHLTCQQANTSSVTSLPVTPTPTPIPQPSEYLLFANRKTIRRLNFDGSGITTIISGQRNAVPVDIHFSENYIYWADILARVINRARLDGSEITTLVNTGLITPDGMAVDWVSDKIYWTDAARKHIEVYEPSTEYRMVLLTTGSVTIPRAIVVDPRTRWLYWSDWGVPARIERSSMDGAARETLHNTSLVWPNALTLDYNSQVLYWADASLNKIESSNVDGSNRRLITVRGLFHPFGITVFQDKLYWSDWRLDAILTRRLGDAQNTSIIFDRLDDEPMGIAVVSEQRQLPAPNPCNGSNCSHFCLLSAITPEGFSCICPPGLILMSNQRDCGEMIMNVTEAPTPQPSIGSCIAAGFTDCNCDTICDGEPSDCFCDLFCFELNDCCSDFREICPENATASTPELTTTLAVSSSRLVQLQSTSLENATASTPAAELTSTVAVPSSRLFRPRSTSLVAPIPSTASSLILLPSSRLPQPTSSSVALKPSTGNLILLPSSRLVQPTATSQSSTVNHQSPTSSSGNAEVPTSVDIEVPLPSLPSTVAKKPFQSSSTTSLASTATPSLKITRSSSLTFSVGVVVAIVVGNVIFLVVFGVIIALIIATFFTRRSRDIGNKYAVFDNPKACTELVMVKKNGS